VIAVQYIVIFVVMLVLQRGLFRAWTREDVATV